MTDETRWLSDQEREAWLALVTIMFTLPGSIESQLHADADLTLAEYLVLAMLSESPDRRRRMTDLATGTNTTPSRLSRIVARLEQDGFVERAGNGTDKRVVLAQITDRGIQKVVDSAPGHVAQVRRTVIDRLTAVQIEQLPDIARLIEEDAARPTVRDVATDQPAP